MSDIEIREAQLVLVNLECLWTDEKNRSPRLIRALEEESPVSDLHRGVARTRRQTSDDGKGICRVPKDFAVSREPELKPRR